MVVAHQTSRLTEWLQQEAGEGLRAIGEYDPDGYRLVYCRDDLSEEAALATLAELHANVSTSSISESRLTDRLGERRASVQLREDGVVLHLEHPAGTHGVFIGLERFCADRLDLFSRRCLTLLYSDSETA